LARELAFAVAANFAVGAFAVAETTVIWIGFEVDANTRTII
jgi:cytidine deaminase